MIQSTLYLTLSVHVLFVKKKDSSIRMCIDYHQLNKLTIKNKYPFLGIDDISDQLQRACWLSKIKQRLYHQLNNKNKDISKTVFCIKYGQYEFLVISFGLTNAQVAFMDMMNQVYKLTLDKYGIIVIDDDQVYPKTRNEHTSLTESHKNLKIE